MRGHPIATLPGARIAEVNRTDAPFPDGATVQALLETQVGPHGASTAVISDHDVDRSARALTYAQLHERANQVAHALRAEGVGPGQIVALLMERSVAMVVGIFAVLKSGAAYLPISPALPPDRIAFMLRDAGVRVLLTQTGIARRTPCDARVIPIDDHRVYQGPTTNPPVVSTPRDLAYVIYTSGSTGVPKGVMIEQRSLVNRLCWMQRAYPIGPHDVILQKTPYSFDVSVWELLWWALHGAAVCLLRPNGERNPRAIVNAIAAHRVSVVHFVPSMLSVFLEYLDARPPGAIEGLASVRQVFASGETLTSAHVRRFNRAWGRRTGARLINLYGPTEATVDVSYFDCPRDGRVPVVPIGRPIDNTRIYVMDGSRELGSGETGELCIAGVGLARGYLNNPALTAERFTAHPERPGERIYHTGDLARWLPDGNLEYLGRKDQQVKIRGFRIELGEIEATVRDFPGVTDCVVQIRRLSESVVLIVAFVAAPRDLDVVALTRHVRSKLPGYMVPHRFERIAAIPTTPSGKADRKALLDHGLRPSAR